MKETVKKQLGYKEKILEYINSTSSYQRTQMVMNAVGCSYKTADKWLWDLYWEGKIRLQKNKNWNSSTNFWLSLKTFDQIRKSKQITNSI